MDATKLISNDEDLYSFILENNLNTLQVNSILNGFLIQKAIFIFDYHTPVQIVNFLKKFFKADNKSIFIDYDVNTFDIKDFYKGDNNLIEFK